MIFEPLNVFLGKIMFFSAYVENNSSFPKPLTKEQEIEYFNKFKAGNKKARTVLINHNLRLVAHVVKKFFHAAEADDLISVGSIGLIKAINSFDDTKGTLLSTYAARCIENEILMLLRVNKKHVGTMSLEESFGTDKDGNEIALMDIIPQEENDNLQELVENSILGEQLESIMKEHLDSREYEVIKLRYGLGNKPAYTQREVASKLNISRSYISRIEKKAIMTLQKYVKEKNIFCD